MCPKANQVNVTTGKLKLSAMNELVGVETCEQIKANGDDLLFEQRTLYRYMTS